MTSSTQLRRALRRASVLLGFLAGPALAQGDFVNFEIHPFRGLAVATVDQRAFVLACNTPDHTLNVIDTVTNSIVATVPTGLSPVSVCWDGVRNRAYVANFVGDSVTSVEIRAQGGGVQTKLLGTKNVGDEPSDVTVAPGGASIAVTLMGESSVVELDPNTLSQTAATWMTVPLLARTAGPPTGAPYAMKHPISLLSDGTNLLVLNQRSNNIIDPISGLPTSFEFHLARYAPSNLGSAEFVGRAGATYSAGAMGSSNMAMQLASDGRIFVAGSKARNDVVGKKPLSLLVDGFVESYLYAVAPPFVQQPSGQTTVQARNLNRSGAKVAATYSTGVANPTGLALYEVGGVIQRAFVTSFSTDRIVALTPNSSNLSDIEAWGRSVINIPAPTANAYGPKLAGPRSLTVKPSLGSSFPSDPGPRLYCLNSLDGTISVYDPSYSTGSTPAQLARISMRDPVPAIVQAGRRFLYDAKKSALARVACASCHIDGDVDGVPWRLDEPTTPGAGAGVIPSILLSGVTGDLLRDSNNNALFPADKGVMMTQSLRGLVDHPVNFDGQAFFTNAPYHWRGDKPGFEDFNEAFVNLMGAPENPPGTGGGLTTGEMFLYTNAVNSIMLEPNPLESLDRALDGAYTVGGTAGSGAMRGQQIFFERGIASNSGNDIAGGRSCSQCHAPGSGSNNRITLVDPLTSGSPDFQPIESARIRTARTRESALETMDTSWSPSFTGTSVRTADFGLLHAGLLVGEPLSLNGFISRGFGGPFFVAGQVPDLERLIRFVRQWDSGMAPIVGRVETLDSSNTSTQEVTRFQTQARLANNGIVCFLRSGTQLQAYYYDVVGSTGANPVYASATGGAGLTLAAILSMAQAPDSCAVFQAVPVGMERRVATLTGLPTPLSGVGAPSNVQLLPMKAIPYWAGVASLSGNWPKGTGPTDFNWDVSDAREPFDLMAIRIFQQEAIWTDNVPGVGTLPLGPTQFDLGTPGMHHEPPRRFRVTGNGILPGAYLELTMSADFMNPMGSNPAVVQKLKIDLFPSESNGQIVWETTAEASPIIQYILLMGGPWAPDVANALYAVLSEPTSPGTNNLAPEVWNRFDVQVVNHDGAGNFFPSPANNLQTLRIE